MVSFIVFYRAVITFGSVDEIPVAVLSCGAVHCAVQDGFVTFESVEGILKCNHSNKSYCTILPVVLFIMLYKVVQTFESVEGIPKCDHSNKIYCTVVSCAVYYAVQGGSNV